MRTKTQKITIELPVDERELVAGLPVVEDDRAVQLAQQRVRDTEARVADWEGRQRAAEAALATLPVRIAEGTADEEMLDNAQLERAKAERLLPELRRVSTLARQDLVGARVAAVEVLRAEACRRLEVLAVALRTLTPVLERLSDLDETLRHATDQLSRRVSTAAGIPVSTTLPALEWPTADGLTERTAQARRDHSWGVGLAEVAS